MNHRVTPIRMTLNLRENFAGLNVDDRIKLSLRAQDPELTSAIAEHHDIIVAETLASAIDTNDYSFVTTVKVEGSELAVSLEKQ